MNIVVVESPAKARTLEKYLGGDYKVLASYGHVRDLPARDGSVRPDNNFSMTYQVEGKSSKHLAAIAKAVKGARRLILATDPDREGEAISWHVLRCLEDKKALKGVEVERVAFNQITKSAVLDAIAAPRQLDMNLVNAQQARRALDYLVGFTLSPVLWRKLPGSRSAGRVQSVALRLICAREAEIEAFEEREYWTVEADFATSEGTVFTTRLVMLHGDKLEKFALPNADAAAAAVKAIEAQTFRVAKVERKQARRNPPPPFTTSTLQQEAARKLGFSARHTMSVAQRLYEGIDIGGETTGLITYMRTDSVQMAGEAVAACRKLIGVKFGATYLPDKPRAFKSSTKNAQEAHEAIRPTGFERTPDRGFLDKDEGKLYALIWKRAVASQMQSARLDKMAIDVVSGDGRVGLRATGSHVAFDGYLKLYREGHDDVRDDSEDERVLPAVDSGAALQRGETRPSQHVTEPPPRFTEASLVKRLEELGIGRPSTYANILSVLQDRSYVVLEKKRFHPEDRGRLVTAFLESFFERYVAYEFTAALEDNLDKVSNGDMEWKTLLREFWDAFEVAVSDISDLRVKEVLEALDGILGPHVFKDGGDGQDPRICPACGDGRLSLKLGRFGAFVGCANYPDCRYTRRLAGGDGKGESGEDAADAPRRLGSDPQSGEEITVRKGPYGYYVQCGEPEGKARPKRVALPAGRTVDDLDLDSALGLLALPREIGVHPESGNTIVAGIGRFGPYLKHGTTFVSLPAADDVLFVGLNRAVSLIADAGSRSTEIRVLGDHPTDGKPVTVKKGRYGPYIQHGTINAPFPKDLSPESISLETAIAQLQARGKPAKRARGKSQVSDNRQAKEKPPSKKKPAKKKQTGKAKKASAKQ